MRKENPWLLRKQAWWGFKGRRKKCSVTVMWESGVFCANFGWTRGRFLDCEGCWCAECYQPDPLGNFEVKEPQDFDRTTLAAAGTSRNSGRGDCSFGATGKFGSELDFDAFPALGPYALGDDRGMRQAVGLPRRTKEPGLKKGSTIKYSTAWGCGPHIAKCGKRHQIAVWG
eukprot:scaffold142337_cov48-Attheya_sp.AAC.1